MNQHIYRKESLGKSFQRLNNKSCRIAYLGSSVTVQKEGYRFFLQKMLCEHSKKQHLEINASIGDTGSITAVFTMEEDVVPYKPDVCFVEYMVSDRVESNVPPDKIGASIEGIVRKLYAIDCEVIFLYRFLEKKLITKAYNKAFLEHEKVAKHYNICSINFGSYIQENIDNGKYQQDLLFKDHTHTTRHGGEVVAQYISDVIFSATDREPSSGVKTNDLNKLNSLHNNCFQNTEIIYTHQGSIKDQSNFEIGQCASRITNHCQHSKQHSYFAIDSKNEFQFDVQGELIGLMVIAGKDSGYIKLESPEEKEDYLAWDKWCHYDRLKTIIINKSYSQLTKLKLRLTDKNVDYSDCRRTIENPNKIIKKLKLVALMLNKNDFQISRFNSSNNIICRGIQHNSKLDFFIKKGDQLKETDKLAQAIEQYFNALQINPSCIQAHHRLAEIYEGRKEFDKAIIHYQSVILKEPENSMILAKLARVMMWKGETKKAITTYQKALAQKQKQPKWFYEWVYKGLDNALRKNNQTDEANAIISKTY
ncbi:MAG: hypothetical protein QNJ53_11460 [Pleurocapsa sp. MO_192.B19]|nr:hypothetical protein [Pleurocapsa sp. MO_192.B19]